MAGDFEKKGENKIAPLKDSWGGSVLGIYNQICFRGKKFLEVGLAKKRQKELPADEILEVDVDVVISSGLFDVLDIDQFLTVEAIHEKVIKELGDDRSYELFVIEIVDFADAREKMLKDDLLKGGFLGVVKRRAKVEDGETFEVELVGLKDELSKYDDVKMEAVSNSLDASWHRQWFLGLNERLLANPESGDKIVSKQRELYSKRQRKELSDDDYQKQVTDSYATAVEESGDEELKEMWEERKSSSDMVEYFDKVFGGSAVAHEETPVSSEEIVQINTEISSSPSTSGFDIVFNDEGRAQIDTDYCSVYVSVYKDLQGGIVYYLEDEFSNLGRIGPVKDISDLPDIIDSRQVDAYVTKKFTKPVAQEDFRYVPDEYFSSIVSRLIGKGSERGYELRNREITILDNLVSFLDSGQLRKKIEKIELYTAKEENARKLSELLLEGKEEDIGKLLA